MNLSAIDLNLLVAFEALFETRNVTLAGQRIHRAQPSVSSALSATPRRRQCGVDAASMRRQYGVDAASMPRYFASTDATSAPNAQYPGYPGRASHAFRHPGLPPGKLAATDMPNP